MSGLEFTLKQLERMEDSERRLTGCVRNTVVLEQKAKRISELFAQRVRDAIPDATDDQIATLEKSLQLGELRLTTAHDLFRR